MRVYFIEAGNEGEAVWDSTDETYSWSYEGSRQEIEDLLSALDNGKVYEDMVTVEAYPDSDKENLPFIPAENWEFVSWKRQLQSLANDLEEEGVDNLIFEE